MGLEAFSWGSFLCIVLNFLRFGVGMNEIQDLSIVMFYYFYLRIFKYIFEGVGVGMNEIQDLGILLS